MMSLHVLLILALILPADQAGSAPQSLPENLQKSFIEGVEALKSGRLDEAERTFVSILQQGGKAAFVYNNLGVVYQQRGDHAKAVEQFRRAIRLDPAYAAPRALIGASLLSLGELPEATRQLERAVRMLPREPIVRLQLARAYERSGATLEMVDQYRILSEMFPRDPEYAYQLGRSYRKLSEWSHERISRIDPRSARLYQTLGQHYLLQGKTDLALQAFRQAAQADPKLPEIHLALARIFYELGKPDEARKEVQQELIIVPNSKAAADLRNKLNHYSSKP